MLIIGIIATFLIWGIIGACIYNEQSYYYKARLITVIYKWFLFHLMFGPLILIYVTIKYYVLGKDSEQSIIDAISDWFEKEE